MKMMAGRPKSPMKRGCTVAKGPGARQKVWNGEAVRTKAGLYKHHLKKDARGKIVALSRSELSKKHYKKSIERWNKACGKARTRLHLEKWTPVGGKTPQGKCVIAIARDVY